MDKKNLREDFPYLSNPNNDKKLIYFDNAATTQKPLSVIDRISDFYKYQNAPIHRGIYAQAEFATELYETSRNIVSNFVDAKPQEIIFTSGTTEGINFICQAWAKFNLKAGDDIILTQLEHHSNLLPWIRLQESLGVNIKFIPITADGNLDYDWFEANISDKTKLVAFTYCSNAIGTEIDAELLIKKSSAFGAKTLIDMAQVVGYKSISLKNLNPDFAVFSGHKMLGPTGIGVLYIKQYLHEAVRPYQVGGGMVDDVTWTSATWTNPPRKFEAGTPPVAQAIGLATACEYLNAISFNTYTDHYSMLCSRLINGLQNLHTVKILGPTDQLRRNGHLVSFVSEKFHSHDIAAYLDSFNIAVRAGNHCAQPLYNLLGLSGAVRVSFYLYNTVEEVDELLNRLEQIL